MSLVFNKSSNDTITVFWRVMEGPHEETLNIVINKCTSLRMYVFLLSSYIREKQGKYSNIDHVLMFSIETLKNKQFSSFYKTSFYLVKEACI